MTGAAQFDLINRHAAPWLTLWLIADFDSGCSYARSTCASGTWTSGDLRGQYQTTSKGMTAWTETRERPIVAVTWVEVAYWVDSLPQSVRDRAADLRAAGHALQADYPTPFPGIGRPYAWDMHPQGTPEQCEKDRADLAAAQEAREVAVRAWYDRKREYDDEVALFLDALRPVEEFDLFGGAA